ncbi:hypothetical protein PAL_GLEAN10011001 [Pteropus alecto]|uniref:Uncharacterized protein n=1 Tax=Pteropus alecto TaxID=9402 RepID=L5KX45_PTEAL|nr:hypothetical protein PAL_GLEAN10011001 [Pteropus alecto]
MPTVEWGSHFAQRGHGGSCYAGFSGPSLEAPGGPYDKQERETLVEPPSQVPQLTSRGRAASCVTALTPQWNPAQKPPTLELLRDQEVGCRKVTRLLFQMV